MRFILTLIVVVILAGIVAVYTGMINLSGQPGALPDVSVSGGALPTVKADVGSIDVGTKNSTVEVPTVTTTEKTVQTPTVEVKKAGEE